MNSEQQVTLNTRHESLLKQAAELVQAVQDPVKVANMTVMDLIGKDQAYHTLMCKMAELHLKHKSKDEWVCALVVIHCERHNLVGINRSRGMYRHSLYDVACTTI